MPESKSPEEQLREEQAKLEVSSQYPIDNPDLEPDRQDQLDKNRVPGQFDEEAEPEETPGLGGVGGEENARGGQR